MVSRTAFPIDGIREVLQFTPDDCQYIRGLPSLHVREQIISVCDPHFADGTLVLPEWDSVQTAVILSHADSLLALPVDCVIGEEEVVVKALPRDVSTAEGFAGASVLGDGRVALITDISQLMQRLTQRAHTARAA